MNSFKQKKLRDLNAVRGASEVRSEASQDLKHFVRKVYSSCKEGDQAVVNATARGANERRNKELRQIPRFLMGVDEAGRGPLAGPVAVGVAVVPFDFDWGLIPNVGDSKKVSPKNREVVFGQTLLLKKKGTLDFVVTLVSAAVIDRIGITAAVAQGIKKGLEKLQGDPENVQVKLDGLLQAPKEYTHQETIIKGDAKEKIIGLASIMAKVTRDRYMVKIAEKYPEYSFEVHKGFGTRLHAERIKTQGFSKIHRRSFCKKFSSSI